MTLAASPNGRREPFRPPSDIGRTKPLVRLVLNQIGRGTTERLEQPGATARRHQLPMMLDEFPALGRLDFFESSQLHAIRRASAV